MAYDWLTSINQTTKNAKKRQRSGSIAGSIASGNVPSSVFSDPSTVVAAVVAASALEAPGVEATVIEAPQIEATVIEAPGVESAGIEASGVHVPVYFSACHVCAPVSSSR